MGLLDSITNQVLGGGKSQDVLINAVMKVLSSQEGGIAGLVKQFSGAGLGDIINSWVSTGANLPVTPAQLQKGLGGNAIGQIAETAGLSKDDVTSQLAKVLPQVIDKLTPNGALPQGDLMSQGMSLLKGLFSHIPHFAAPRYVASWGTHAVCGMGLALLNVRDEKRFRLLSSRGVWHDFRGYGGHIPVDQSL